MGRLLTTLLLYRSGYYVGKYISLEGKIARNKDPHYKALEASQQGWQEGTYDPTPFIKYLLSVILAAYRDFDERMELVEGKRSALECGRQQRASSGSLPKPISSRCVRHWARPQWRAPSRNWWMRAFSPSTGRGGQPSYDTGEVLERIPGSLRSMPDGRSCSWCEEDHESRY